MVWIWIPTCFAKPSPFQLTGEVPYQQEDLFWWDRRAVEREILAHRFSWMRRKSRQGKWAFANRLLVPALIIWISKIENVLNVTHVVPESKYVWNSYVSRNDFRIHREGFVILGAKVRLHPDYIPSQANWLASEKSLNLISSGLPELYSIFRVFPIFKVFWLWVLQDRGGFKRISLKWKIVPKLAPVILSDNGGTFNLSVSLCHSMQIIILFLAGAEVNDGTSLLEGQHAGRGSARRDWAAPSPTRKRTSR